MHGEWAAKHLQVIRTLMERSALYRQALAPIMLRLGFLGLAAGGLGYASGWDDPRAFIGLWIATATVAFGWTLGMVRRQALKDEEPFWSPPARRVVQALLPPLAAGMFFAFLLLAQHSWNPLAVWGLTCGWMVLYGCAMNAAGFFMPRGMKLFGWLFIGAGCATLLALTCPERLPLLRWGHLVMGGVFGGLHLTYGVYLRWTETNLDAV